MAKRCEEEFNPWPPFVDVFSSVILVLLLFLLITIVNVGYYSQFKSKTTRTGSVESEDAYNAAQLAINRTDHTKQVRFEKIDDVKESETVIIKDPPVTIHSLFTGGESEGNVIKRDTIVEEVEQKVESISDEEMFIIFENSEIFLSKKIIDQIKSKADTVLRIYPNAKIKLAVGDPIRVPGATVAKQISLGRILNLRNKLRRKGYTSSQIEIKYDYNDKLKYDYGYLKITVDNKVDQPKAKSDENGEGKK